MQYEISIWDIVSYTNWLYVVVTLDFDKPFGEVAFSQPFEATFDGGAFEGTVVLNSTNPFADAFEEAPAQQAYEQSGYDHPGYDQPGYDQPGSFDNVFDHQPFGGKFEGTPFGDSKKEEGDTENPFADDKPFNPELENIKEPEPVHPERPPRPALSPSPTPPARPISPATHDRVSPHPQGLSTTSLLLTLYIV